MSRAYSEISREIGEKIAELRSVVDDIDVDTLRVPGVLAKRLYESERLQVLLCSKDGDEQLPPHTHDESTEWLIVTRGEILATMWLNQGRTIDEHVGAFNSIEVPPGMRHHVVLAPETEILTVLVPCERAYVTEKGGDDDEEIDDPRRDAQAESQSAIATDDGSMRESDSDAD